MSRHAQALLETENPAVLASALDMLAVLAESNPTLTKDEDNNPFTECATFADDIKGTYDFQDGWHFIDQPYLLEGGDLSDFDFTMDSQDVIQALNSLTAWLRGTGDYK